MCARTSPSKSKTLNFTLNGIVIKIEKYRNPYGLFWNTINISRKPPFIESSRGFHTHNPWVRLGVVRDLLFGLLIGRRTIVNSGKLFRNELQEKEPTESKDLNTDSLKTFPTHIPFESTFQLRPLLQTTSTLHQEAPLCGPLLEKENSGMEQKNTAKQTSEGIRGRLSVGQGQLWDVSTKASVAKGRCTSL